MEFSRHRGFRLSRRIAHLSASANRLEDHQLQLRQMLCLFIQAHPLGEYETVAFRWALTRPFSRSRLWVARRSPNFHRDRVCTMIYADRYTLFDSSPLPCSPDTLNPYSHPGPSSLDAARFVTREIRLLMVVVCIADTCM